MTSSTKVELFTGLNDDSLTYAINDHWRPGLGTLNGE